MDRVKTGIPGLDNALRGGIPEGAAVLLAGGPGTGKTILSLQFLYEGAKTHKDPGLYVTFETSIKNLSWNMESFDWDIRALQDKNLFKIYKLNLSSRKPAVIEQQLDAELRVIAKIVKEMGVKRLVVDSTTSFAAWVSDNALLRTLLYDFASRLKELNCTTILTSEVRGGPDVFSAFGVEEFVADGVIAMYFVPPNRAAFVRKMRGTNHSKKVHPLDITQRGIVISDKDEVLWQSLKK